MTEQEMIAALQKQLGLDKSTPNSDPALSEITKFMAEQREKELAAQRAAEKKAQEEAMQKRVDDLIAKATEEQKGQLKSALELIQTMSDSKKTSDEDFTKQLKANEETISKLSEQLKQIMLARDGRTPLQDAMSLAALGNQANFNKTAEELVLLAKVTKKGVFDTEAGKAHLKAVNVSSSEEVSSEAYETIFHTNILRDIQKELIIGNLFTELPMTAANLVMPVQGGPDEAKWVDASTYGKPETTGEWQKDKLSEITFKTFKLAAKAFITDETAEDAIIALLPIIRARIIESHAVAIEKAFMSGDGNGKPKGLLTLAKDDGTEVATKATADSKVMVTAAEINGIRRVLKSKGINLNKLALVVSLDAYFDLTEDEEWKDVAQVDAANAVKLTGQVGRIYGLPVVISEYFPDKAAGAPYALLVYTPDFIVPRQRELFIEDQRDPEAQRYNIFVTQRVNLQRYFDTHNVVVATYAK